MLETVQKGGRTVGAGRTPVIDVDVHEGLRSVRELLPYLVEPWRGRVAASDGWEGIDRFPYPYPQIAGVAMAEAATGDGSPAGSSYEQMRDQLLDAHGIEYAILVSSFQSTDMRTQPEFASALASAYNDWVLDNWLVRDERLRGSVTIAAQDPHAAAREMDRVGSDPRMVQVNLPASTRDVFARAFYRPIFGGRQERPHGGIPPHELDGDGRRAADVLHRVAHGGLAGVAEPAYRARVPRRLRRVSGASGRDAGVELDVGAEYDVAPRP